MTNEDGKDDSLERRLERLADEFAERRRRGEPVTVSEYVEKYPDLAQEIRQLFPGLVFLEEARAGGREVPDFPPPPSTVSPNDEPRTLGHYRILREVGRGGMGVVFEAEHESLGRRVALKVLPFHLLEDDQLRERFQREARAASSLEHPNIVRVYDVGEEEGVPFYAMQFVDGPGLHLVLEEVRRQERDPEPGNGGARSVEEPEILPSSPSLASRMATRFRSGDFAERTPACDGSQAPPEPTRGAPVQALEEPTSSSRALRDPVGSSSKSHAQYCRSVARLGVQLGAALHYAHEQGILHRDIKPSNLLLDLSGTVYVSDFGLAKARQCDDLTRTGDIVGTLKYMAPERFRGWADPRSDVWSLGLTLYELVTFRPAFDDLEQPRLVRKIAQDEPPRPRRLDPRIPRDLETVILKAISKEPAHRYQTAGDLADDLDRFLSSRPILARPSRTWQKAAKWARRSPATAALIGVSLLALLVLLFGSLWYNARLERKSAQSDANLRKACETVNNLFTWLGEEGLSSIPQMEPVRREVLARSLHFYENLLAEGNLKPDLRLEAARAYGRMGEIYRILHQPVEARNAYIRALALLERLGTEFPEEQAYKDELATNRSRLALLQASLTGASEAAKVVKYSIATEGGVPSDIVALDLDDDGDLDLATADQNSNSVSLLWNQGGRIFTADGSFAVGAVPFKIGAGDLDGDGDADLVTIDQASRSASVLLNLGNRAFEDTTTIRLLTEPWGLDVVDLDGDDKCEVAVAVALTYVQIIRHTPSGKASDESFALGEKMVVAGNVNGLVAADLDGDEDVDLAVGCIVLPGRTGKYSILLNEGDGTFAPALHFETGCFPVTSAAADLDGDGKVDLATIDSESGALALFLNEGDASFKPGLRLTLEPGILTLVAADLDGDGYRDLALSKRSSGEVWVLRNNREARFPGVFEFSADGNATRLAAADLDGDGLSDLAMANGAAGNVAVLYNGPGLFAGSRPEEAPGTDRSSQGAAVSPEDRSTK